MDRLESLTNRLYQMGSQDEDDFPLGRSESRREMVIKAAVEAADELIMEGSDGSDEDTNYLTGEVALKLLEKTIHPLRSAVLAKDIKERHEARTK